MQNAEPLREFTQTPPSTDDAQWPNTTLVMMTKYPTPGRVKTRLGCEIGMERAAELHELFTRHLSDQLASAGDQRVIALTPDSYLARFEGDLDNLDWQLTGQGGGDLGDRMARLFQTYLNEHRGPVRVVLTGTDCPLLTDREIADAAEKLLDNDIVVGPAIDGGYYLIGIRSPWKDAYAALFSEIPWGTRDVFTTTKQRVSAAELSLAVLPLKADIDTTEDLGRFCAHLEASRHSSPLLAELCDHVNAILGVGESETRETHP
ncbi:TIGR04282 family arsenosugar biosynthesis glycosyltransferase [Novipirellula artificiosorum]|nr:TIGR04282 family arsenosugar biosynthesis glycosyltransferase [Novipirellula artificiosorum]